jgi:hypothetical protein
VTAGLTERVAGISTSPMSKNDGNATPAAPDPAPEPAPQPAARKPLTPAAERALAEAAARRSAVTAAPVANEIKGRGGLDPVRYGDWEVKGLTSDF